MVTKSCSLTAPKLTEALGILSSVHGYLEVLFGWTIDDLGVTVTELLSEGSRRRFRVHDNISLLDMDKRRLTRMVKGALDMTIHAHGPITKENSGSAAKRAVGFILRGHR